MQKETPRGDFPRGACFLAAAVVVACTVVMYPDDDNGHHHDDPEGFIASEDPVSSASAAAVTVTVVVATHKKLTSQKEFSLQDIANPLRMFRLLPAAVSVCPPSLPGASSLHCMPGVLFGYCPARPFSHSARAGKRGGCGCSCGRSQSFCSQSP